MNLRGQYIEISSEEEMDKASKWLESLGYENNYPKLEIKKNNNKYYLFIASNKSFHFNIITSKSNLNPFSVLYDNGMPREEEDLISKAKRLYPIGTQYKCAAGGDLVHTVESMNWNKESDGINKIYGEEGKGCIYKHGKWAKIIHEVKPVEQKEEFNYIVGRWYKTVEHNYYAKCFDFRSNTMIASQYRVMGYNNGKMGNYTFCSGYKWVEATQEELATLLPEGHPDLINSIEKWSAGSYGVFLTANKYNYPKGTIEEIEKNTGDKAWFKKYGSYMPENPSYQGNDEFKWFATLEEAEAFSKSLTWAEIIETPKTEVLTSNQSTYQPIVTAYSYWVKETHQSSNKRSKFSPIKAELIKVKQLKKLIKKN